MPRSASALSLAIGRLALGALAAACAPPGQPAAPDVLGGDATVADGGSERALTVLSLNLHCLKTEGTRFASNAERFAAIADVVAAERVDVILAQEVCASASTDARTALVTALDAATGATWGRAETFAHRAWEGTPDEADEYVAIFARGEVSAARETVHRVQGSLRRVALGATIASTLEHPVRVLSVHLDHATADARAAQAREVATTALVEADDPSIARAAGDGAVALPVIVAGDFNARSGEPAPRALVDFGFVEASGSAATTRIDHVFAHRSAPLAPSAAREVFTGADAVSDHPGVLVRFVPAPSTGARLTRLVASGSFARPLALRGDAGPLAWDAGWPAIARPDHAVVVTSELPAGPFEYKFLRDDVDWQLGPNERGTGEADNLASPQFP